ncbi:tetratricopeptide repeat protein [Vibrio salinus]|uniref:tetratricopeptide repeat protein n=1 Tax=Vibrio salinus TaxID=2899784 RepID=UPI001E4E7AA2|nr:tetratricopeptide repeat protein [Vibrio salinus]MCE0495826.1 tetratricopeptide repeat protein [Vibrio salinus]
MLKKMGFYDSKIHKAGCLSTFRALIRTHPFNLIICRYSAKQKSACQNYLHLYQECELYLRECSVIFVTEQLNNKEEDDINHLQVDNFLEIPFNYNQFNPLIADSLIKRKILAVVHSLIEQEKFTDVFEICDLLTKKKSTWRTEVFKATIEHYITCKKYDFAINLLNDLRVKEPNEWLFIKLIEINSMLGQFNQALDIAHEFEALGFPEHPLISEITAQQSILNSDTDAAIKIIQKVITRYPNLIPATINLAYLYIASGEYDKALSTFSSINSDNIISDEQLLCVEECRLYLEVRLNIIKKNINNPPAISHKLEELLLYTKDSKDSTQQFYSIINNINDQNPICSEKKLIQLWKKTSYSHRKLLIIAIAYYFGYLDLLTEWLNTESKKISSIKSIDDAIKNILIKSMHSAVEQKQKQIELANKMKQNGKHVESFVILSREAPSAMIHHIQLVNSITKDQSLSLSIENESMDNVLFQFKYSISILMKNLLRHNPNHPKLESLKEINRMVTSRFNFSQKNRVA